MSVSLNKRAVDIGIVVRDGPAALRFYRDTLGFEQVKDMPIPGGSTMHRLRCGDSLIKIVVPVEPPEIAAPPGGLQGATGYRYWTIHVSNLDEILQACRDGGYQIAIEPVELRPGTSIGMVEDPEGNWVEFVQEVPA